MNADNTNTGNEENEKDTAADKTDDQAVESTAQVTPGNRITLVLIFLIALAALLLSAFNYHNSGGLQEQADITGTLDRHALQIRELTSLLDKDIPGTLDRHGSQIRDTAAMLEAVGNKVAGIEDELSRLSEQLRRNSVSLQQLFEERKIDSDDWIVAEIEYLVLIASHRLSLEGDVNTALAALKAADNRLARLGDPALYDIRKQLAADMNALRAVPAVDITGKSLYLADMATRVENLPLQEAAPPEKNVEGKVTDNKEQPGWRRLLSAVWEEIKDMVIITRTGDLASVNLLPDERYFLYQNLRLQLETARLALIRRDTGNFRISIDIITGWLQDYFDTDDSRVMDIISTLQEMRSLDLDPALPDISASLENLRNHIEERAVRDSSSAETVDQ